jgi:hypothetical protein
MRTTPRSESEAQKVSKRTLLKPGWLPARITEAIEKVSKAGNDTIELSVSVEAAQGEERTFRDWLTDSNMGAAKLRSCCNAVGALDRYEAGEISQDDFPGRDVQVKISIEKKRGFPDRNIIEDYRASASASVVNLRAAG